MWTSLVVGVLVVVRVLAMARDRIRDAHADVAVLVGRETVGAGERPEVMIEGTILLDHEDQVVDVEDAERRVDVAGAGARGHRTGADDEAVANNAQATIVSATIREPVLLLMDETC